MSNLFKQLILNIKSAFSQFLDKREDPRKILDYAYKEQVNQLHKLQKAMIEMATARKRIEYQIYSLTNSRDKCLDDAKKAVALNREDLAKNYLNQKVGISNQIDSLTEQRDSIFRQEEKIKESMRSLKMKVEGFKTQKETIKANYTAAEARNKINDIFGGFSDNSENIASAVERAKEKTEMLNAKNEAIEDLENQGGLIGSDNINDELTDIQNKSVVELELEELKRASITNKEDKKQIES